MTPPSDVLAVIAEQKPKFQLLSGVDSLPSSENHFFAHGAADTSHLSRASHEVEHPTAVYLLGLLWPDFHTLEIGGGVSTVIFASRVAHHTCVNPDRTANKLIAEFLARNAWNVDGIAFVAECSDRALPALRLAQKLDVVLIDGNHSFPFPQIDWHYVDPWIKEGGRLFVDNVSINAVRMLCDFLLSDPCYRFVIKVGDCMVFERTAATRRLGWADQEINRRNYVGYRAIEPVDFMLTKTKATLRTPVKWLRGLTRRR